MATKHSSPFSMSVGDLIAAAGGVIDLLDCTGAKHEAQVVRELCYRLFPDTASKPHPAILPDKPRSIASKPVLVDPPERPFSDGKVWCDQCDARKTRDQIKGCRSAFCKVKGLAE